MREIVVRRLPIFVFVSVLASVAFSKTSFEFSCDRTNGIYRCGEVARINVRVRDVDGNDLKSGAFKIRLDNFGNRVFQTSDWMVSDGSCQTTIQGTLNDPGFLRLEVSEIDSDGHRIAGECFGVAFDPYRIQSGTSFVPDFASFWNEAICRFEHEISGQVKATVVDSSESQVMYELEIPTLGGRTLWGYLREPRVTGGKKFRTVVTVPGAGPSVYGVSCPDDEIAMLMNVHYYPPIKGLAKNDRKNVALMRAEENEWAARYPMSKIDYPSIGIASGREHAFYYPVILGMNRAVNWLAKRPNVDRSRFHYSSTSQGGGFGLWLCGINRNFTRAAIYVPALTDLMGYRQNERRSGWPRMIESQLPENRRSAEKWAPYFDGVNFARQIKIPIHYEVGSSDSTCPPMAGFSAYNVTPSKVKRIELVVGQGHAVAAETYRRIDAWLKEGD